MRKSISLAFALTLTTSSLAWGATVSPDAYSPQDVLIGATPSVQAFANNGKGVIFGDIDTGITAQWAGFTSAYNGQGINNINTAADAVCLNGVCPTGAAPVDQNGHGTFTASEIVGGIPSIGMEGVAPAGTLIAVQVLSASGSGYSNDVANGITYAVNHGAQVLNLSLGPSGTASQQAAFYESLASAVNYAASKGAIIVFAGGNSSQAFAAGADITGFTTQAIEHMIFMGSTNASEKLSSFSNTPGSGYFISSTTGQHYAYDTMWMMADGENIWGASNYYTKQYGYTYITQMSGTSMAAPQATGAAGLLAAKWPFLLNNPGTPTAPTIPQILEMYATDLGTKGIDTTYGDGFLNVGAAMQPAGTLSVPTSGGKMVQVSSSQIVSGGAMGNLSKVSNALSNAVGFDSFMRDFPLAAYAPSVITTKTAIAVTSPATAAVSGYSGASARSFTDTGNGGWLSFAGAPMSADTVPGGSQNDSFTVDPTRLSASDWYYGFSEGGTYMGFGQGSNVTASFNDARWGDKTAFSNTDSSASGALLGLAEGANFLSYGTPVGKESRLAVSMVTTSGTDNSLLGYGVESGAHGAAVAYTYEPEANWKVSLTGSYLNENNQLLGSPSSGYLAMGPQATTRSVGLGTNVGFGDGYQLGFDAAYAVTSGAGGAESFVTGTSTLGSESFSLALTKDDVSGVGDKLGITVDKPLRITSGSASLAVPVGQDDFGNPIIENERTSLVPNGSETDLGFVYNRPIEEGVSTGLNVQYREDADNVAGAHDAAAMARLDLKF